MSDRNSPPSRSGRRTFLGGLLTGAGVVAALGAATRRMAGARTSVPETPPPDKPGPILYRRTEETARYYRTLYQ